MMELFWLWPPLVMLVLVLFLATFGYRAQSREFERSRDAWKQICEDRGAELQLERSKRFDAERTVAHLTAYIKRVTAITGEALDALKK